MDLDLSKDDLNFIIKLLLKESTRNEKDKEAIQQLLFKLMSKVD